MTFVLFCVSIVYHRHTNSASLSTISGLAYTMAAAVANKNQSN
jgi:hypothetical protein